MKKDSMNADLLSRLRYEEGIAACSRRLLAGGDDAIRETLAILLDTAAASRAYLFENFEDPGAGLCARQVLEVCAPGVAPQIDDPRLRKVPYTSEDFIFSDALVRGEPFWGIVKDMPEGAQKRLRSRETQSLLAIPLRAAGALHGFIGLDDTRGPRQWQAEDVRLLNVVADLIGAHAAREQATRELADRQAKLESILRSSPAGHGIVKDRVILEVSERLCRMTGYTAAELVGRSARVLYPSDKEYERVGATHETLIAQEGSGLIESHFRRKDGTVFSVLIGSSPLYPGDLSAGAYFSAVDITESRELRESLERERNLLRMIIDNVPDDIYVRDLQNRFVFVSKAGAELMGLGDPAQVVGRTDMDFFPRELAEKFAQDDRKVLEEGQTLGDIEELVHRGAGGVRWSLTTKLPLRDAAGQVTGLLGIGRNITKRKVAEEALQRSEEQYHSLFNAIGDAVFIHDPEGRLRDVNDAACRALGYTRDELLRLSMADIDSSGSVEKVAERAALVRDSGAATFEYSQVRKDGTRFPVEVSAVSGSFGGKPAVISVVRDVSRRRQLEDQLAQAHKMEAVGRLAGGVAHDFNNLLTVMNGYGQLVLDRLPETSPLRTDVQEMLRAAKRAASLTEQLLSFSRKQVLKPQIVAVNRLVEDLRKMLSRLVGEDVSLEVLLSENAGNVLADPGRIEQVIVNLAVNARDAMPGGGTLTLETSMRRIGAQGLPRHPQIGPGVYACILVRDTGQGIGAEALEHLFEPFYTTKEQGKGTGLGLATSYGIVKQSGGFIFCDSRPGGGTSFTIYLPRVEGGETPAAASGATERQTGRETVLLVEDEGMVRTFTRRILEQSGYAVVEAGDGPSALAAAEKLGDSLDLLVTDVVMPVMGGREVAERIRKMRRGVRTLFISGYAEEAVERHGHLAGDAPLIQKPFTAQAFLATIRQILDSRPPLG